ncbi:hypothetical protein DICPUDRAFT_38359 [Dictyostelium purpureum]|uniref:SRR1-like domain-containing protein n=1 Tax=Dictyostelium purpureum TaxID=5786 RepID=F0ZUB3_DICPU|nr:uncharacterized protein DICPUDRAFT_38359 [Dictyostelium purpureum]EGC32469.1 hypothetical protein DICPUDRAFT_38359 [Dictyostelium purpureum]|eukprot:XP_003291003.1 hypothetical protein DICPUDRAFT_38359 [Dictyostelium purpureum]
MKETQFFKDIIESQTNFKYSETENITLYEHIHDIVCYGIGDFSSSKKCLDQLAYITSVKSIYNVSSIYIYDPVMNEIEKKLVDKIGFKLIEVNEEGKRKINMSIETNNRFTLFYMPFCGRKLYDNVLWANWEDLSKVLIIGNSFDIYIDGINKVEDDYVQYSYTSKTAGIHNELLFPKNYPTPYIFHDLSIHIFPKHLLSTKEDSFYSKSKNLEPPKLIFGPE